MLNRIARVIYPTTTGWTREACEYLRDQLVDLIGGERDAQHVCAGGAGGCVRHDVQEEVNNGISGGDCGVREVCHDSDLRDMGDCHVSKEALVTYDAIGNERYKAACALEERKPILGMTKTEIFGDLGKAVTNDPNFDPSDIDHLNLMWSTLIHLLGGERDAQRGCACSADTCNHSYEQTPFVGYDTLGNERHKAVCALRKLRDDVDNFSSYYDFTEKLLSAFKINDCCWDDGLTSLCDRLIHLLGGDQVMRYPENYDLGDESDAQNDENGDICESNHQTITDELREFKGHINAGMTPETVLALRAEINAIADRIDEQFARICEQQERVLQDTIDHMQDEIDEHKEQRRVLAGNCLDYTDECWNLYDLLRDAACEYKELHDLLESIEHDVDEGGWITLFGVNYVPVSTDYETFNDMKLIKLYYKKLKQWMGEAKSLRDNLATRVEGRDHVRQELEEYRKALNETAGKLIKADAECRMYRDLLNDEAREYVRHKEATDSMYKSFNDVFEAMERLL